MSLLTLPPIETYLGSGASVSSSGVGSLPDSTPNIFARAIGGLTNIVKEAVPLAQAYNAVKTAGEPERLTYEMGARDYNPYTPIYPINTQAAIPSDRQTVEAAQRGGSPVGFAMGGGVGLLAVAAVVYLLIRRK